jgi:hypothetical protein
MSLYLIHPDKTVLQAYADAEQDRYAREQGPDYGATAYTTVEPTGDGRWYCTAGGGVSLRHEEETGRSLGPEVAKGGTRIPDGAEVATELPAREEVEER